MMSGVVKSVNDNSRDNGEENAKADCKERQAILPGVETVHSCKGERVCGEEGEKDGECKCRIQTEEQHNRFREQHVQWS
jgi:hypothetical protein